jgi:hypothetical protein
VLDLLGLHVLPLALERLELEPELLEVGDEFSLFERFER